MSMSPPEEVRSSKPVGHPAVASGRIGVLIVNLGTPEGTDYWSMRRYLKEFLSDPRVIEAPRAIWLPILQLILLRRPSVRGRDYASIWNAERDEGPLKTITRAQSEKLGAALSALGPQIGGRLGDALREAAGRRAAQGAQGEGLRPHSRHAALSAIFRGLDRDRLRQGLRYAEGHALAARAEDRRALLRRPDLYRSARKLGAGGARRPRFRAGGGARLLSRNSAILFRQGRSLLLPLRQDDAPLARGAGLGRGPAQDDLPVAIRPRRMAEALHRRDGRRTGGERQ